MKGEGLVGLEWGQGIDMTEPLARQLDLVDPGRLPGRGEWCLVGEAGPRETKRKLYLRKTGLGGQERQDRGKSASSGGNQCLLSWPQPATLHSSHILGNRALSPAVPL